MENSNKLYWDIITRDFILDDIDEAICLVDNKGTVLVWNKKSELIYNVTKEELLGKPMDSVLEDTVIMNVLNSGDDMENIYQSTRTGCKTLVNAKVIYKNGEKIGALCVDKDLSEIDRLKSQVDNLKSKISYLETQNQNTKSSNTIIASNSVKMEELIYKATRVAKTDTTVMLAGESGVGKKALAKSIHEMSGRTGLFVTVNCGAIPNEFFETEFFGSYDSKTRETKPGFFEVAENGTIFLGEITDMPIKMQSKLLNVLQNMEIVRVGGKEKVKISTRIVSATNRDISSMVESGEFLEDLYYRLNVIELLVPPLRERKSDIALLADMFLKEMSEKYEMITPTIEPEVMNTLIEYSWKGNIRELKNIIEHMVVMSGGKSITMEILPYSIKESTKNFVRTSTQVNDLAKSVGEYERHIIEEVLEDSKWNKSEAARALNIPRTTLMYKIELYGLEKPKKSNAKKRKK